MKIEENRFRNLVEINKKIEKQCNYDYLYEDGYSTEEEISEVDYDDYDYDDNEDESDSN